MDIREATQSDLEDVLMVEREAFGHNKEAELVRGLLDDPSAKPLLSLLALDDDRAIGHILFTSVRLADSEQDASMMILAPLAIVPAGRRRTAHPAGNRAACRQGCRTRFRAWTSWLLSALWVHAGRMPRVRGPISNSRQTRERLDGSITATGNHRRCRREDCLRRRLE